MKNRLQQFSAFGLALLIVSCQHEKPTEATHHLAEPEVEDQYLMSGLDHGLMQSPINILSNEASSGNHNITFNFNGEINKVENLGHTVQLTSAAT